MSKTLAELEDKFNDILPHGSGINGIWEYDQLKNGTIIAKNFFHCMDEHGYYDGYANFTLYIPENSLDFKLEFNGYHAQNKNRQYMLREYLEDIIYCSLED